ncbi:prolyl oligopeptidase family serine peptidase [Dehalococcoidia bacterium]|nr:prolyl oligopeptidase family serine peptidase [Dehalococcoidia bacterium]MCL0056116.1 prolyl oligopeptidase family serine peptidase [Dehalococcoidia bacterium]MCL0090891.1 prolyl oligopeptidase family serine peptidase [Dehalococcoidia bacterium]
MNEEEYLDALLSLPALVASQVSPDGKWAAWSWFRVGPTADIYIVPTDGSTPPIRLTDTPEDTMVVSWTPDSKALVVGQDHDGDERVQLFRVDIARPKEMVPLTEASPNYFVHGGELHPNGHWLVYGANFDASTGEEIEPTWIYRHDLMTGERRVLARPEKACWADPKLNRQGTHILYTRKDLHPAGEQIWMVDIDGKEDVEILNFGSSVKVSASWFPDGQRVIFLAEAGTCRRLGMWDSDRHTMRWLLDDPARNLEYAFVPYGSEQAVIVEITNARVHSSLLNVETGEEVRLPEIPGNLVPLAPVGHGEWIGRYYSARQPTDLIRFSPSEPGAFVGLTRVWEHTPLRQDDLAMAEDFRWKSTDGLPIQGWLYRARGYAKGTIVCIHGGPTSHSEDELSAMIQFFVSRGFNVLDPNYRGSTGFGLAFQEKIKEDGWGGREQEDIRTGIEALLSAGFAKPTKVGVTGTSYGGYSSWCAITRYPPEIVAAAAPICGMTDLIVDYNTTRPDLRPYSREMLGGSPEEVPARYHERSPINFVHQIRGRLLIVQGAQDPNVTPENVRAVTAALDGAGIEYDLLTFADEGHGIARPRNLKTLYLRLAEFFEKAFCDADGVI